MAVVLKDDSGRAVELVETDGGASEVLASESEVSKIELVRLLDETPSLEIDEIDV